MNYKFYSNSEKAWRGMYEAIDQAQFSIYLETYIFRNDMEEYNFFKLLIKKANEGLKIFLVLDYVGSFALNKKEIDELKESKIEVLFSSHFLHRIHRKILIVDESIAFIGGVNFRQGTFFWKDLVVRIKGKRLVKRIINSFIKVYISLGGKNLILKESKIKLKINKTKNWLVEHIPVFHKFSLKNLYKEELDNAKESVIIITPYFAPKFWLRKKLIEIISRGVSVKVLIPSSVDVFVADRANYFYMNKMAPHGISFYLEPFMNHAKAIMIDDKKALVGSQNIDFLSFDYNSEIGVFFNDINSINNLKKIIDKWENESVLFDYKKYKLKWYDHLLSPLMVIFSKIF